MMAKVYKTKTTVVKYIQKNKDLQFVEVIGI